jgi:hypothetical protein
MNALTSIVPVTTPSPAAALAAQRRATFDENLADLSYLERCKQVHGRFDCVVAQQAFAHFSKGGPAHSAPGR